MRQPGRIEPHLSVEKMFQWLQRAPDQSSHKKRMAIWLTFTGKIHAPKVAEILGVSTQAVWLWISQYNSKGPDGLKRKGRGGRRWAFLSREQEAKILEPFLKRARLGNFARAAEVKPVVERALGRSVSMSYIYRMLRRNGWSEAIAQSHPVAKSATKEYDFRKISQPWRREG